MTRPNSNNYSTGNHAMVTEWRWPSFLSACMSIAAARTSLPFCH
ncbi:hypothetical protein Pla52o_57320 [Novipirellula galeiformis]|uniref:Uncharacterized protein n=1 Tax=Novipirellula galeiformis TaxID=2528004 RepID=A0A5C6BG45_9BACT|nr:hypothetical protein Pla52o_57320 [Novipirellula galeiformis]